jgi:hypothetical protein
MNILFFGDIVGKIGRNVVIDNISLLKEQYNIDFTIANAENSAHGKGITSKIYRQLINSGVDCITLGNHSFAKNEIRLTINDCPDLIRPYNLEPTNLGNAYKIYFVNGKTICVTNIMGQAFIERASQSPYDAMSDILEEVEADYFFVDLHAETTGEKIVFANYFKDECIAVVGTHTHVQTADERLIDKCAFITDVGMCGAYDSILGRDTHEVITNLIYKEKTKYTISNNPAMLCAVVIEIDDEKQVSKKITRIQIRPND